MLWHFQNGGLTGHEGPQSQGRRDDDRHEQPRQSLSLRARTPPTASSRCSRRLHHQLPKSKILLLAIFPRGDTPTDKGRIRNDQINKIIRTYADNQTVYWLDIGHVFLDENGNMNRDLMPDRLHPSVAGYQAWVKAMEPTLAKLLEQ
jgi:lysophospholipase L1-like esterase